MGVSYFSDNLEWVLKGVLLAFLLSLLLSLNFPWSTCFLAHLACGSPGECLEGVGSYFLSLLAGRCHRSNFNPEIFFS